MRQVCSRRSACDALRPRRRRGACRPAGRGPAGLRPEPAVPGGVEGGAASRGRAAAPAPAPDPLGRQTPSGAVMGFLAAAAKSDWPRAAKYLDTRLPQDRAEELARQLKVLLDRGLSIDLARLSGVPEGEQDERFGKGRELVGSIATKSGKLDVLLARVQRGGRAARLAVRARDAPGRSGRLRGVRAVVGRGPAARLSHEGLRPRYMLWSWLIVAASSIAALLLGLLTRQGRSARRCTSLLRLVAPGSSGSAGCPS